MPENYREAYSALADEIRRSRFDLDDGGRSRFDLDDGDIERALDRQERERPVPELADAEDDDELLVEAWNEKPGRTKGQVLALLDAAIRRRHH